MSQSVLSIISVWINIKSLFHIFSWRRLSSPLNTREDKIQHIYMYGEKVVKGFNYERAKWIR